MASTPDLEIDPWQVREPAVSAESLPVTESLLSLSNGYLGIRGTLDEVEPHGARGTFLAGVHETHPLSYPEEGYGHPEEGQAMIAVADATPLRLVVDGTPLDIRTIEPESHHRTLDLRTGILERVLVWRTLAGARLELRSQRLVSLRERSLAAIRYRVRVLDGAAHVVVRSQLVLGASPPEVDSDDPRVADVLDHPFEQLALSHGDDGGALSAVTRRTGMTVAAAVRHVVDGADDIDTHAAADDHVVTTITAALTAGHALEIIKTFGHVWSTSTTAASELEAARAVVDSGVDRGWDGLVAAQREELDGLWAVADVEVEGDDELQQALRFSIFTLLTGTACTEGAPVGAKGLTGLGYSGHTFWDIEGFVIPTLSLLVPDAASRLLAWRASTLDAARERARVLGLQGASFAWRTIDGRETSAYWPASTAAMHVNADVSRAFWLHGHVTGTGPVPLGGLAVLVETARLWLSLGHHDLDGVWHLFGMTGPDEYTGVVDDNLFTNLMARRNLVRAAEVCEQLSQEAAELGVTPEETQRWRAAATAVHVPWDERRQVHAANTGFTSYQEWDFEENGHYPVQEHHHYSTIYRHQILKQADTELALWWCREDFTDEQIARDVDYYEARTVRDSSLSAGAQAVACAKAQHPDLAYRYLRECALVDLRDLQGDTEEGLHLASVGGTWLALTAGLGGLREDHEDLELAPLLPSQLTRMCYRVTWRGRLLQVETTRAGTTVTMLRGEHPVGVVIDGEPMEVAPGAPASAPLREPTPLLPEPNQPTGRAPRA
ncbi:glycoside hydrolase family 65 protein [Pseudactinotalea suaedae]|uniref:glycoside hydrolase family 65 protein n=1 Tax=Pseudactinotalea suaedae TaxID=1524924 RepID=UPI0012E1ED50|nr:glycosyl hydrolase family 65 protein [Pseudactinotalea suaedae]